MTPPRHVLLHIPQGRGLTRANLNQLEYLGRVRNNIRNYGNYSNRNNNLRQEENVIYTRIARNGGHANAAAARLFTGPYITKLRRLKRALITNNRGNQSRNVVQERRNKAWGRVQEAAGAFKRGLTAAQLRELAIMLGGGHNARLLAQLVRRHGMSPVSPIRTTKAQYNASVARERRRVQNAERRRVTETIQTARRGRARAQEEQLRAQTAARSAARSERAARRGGR